MTEAANAAQIDYWNETAGPVWVRMQAQLDHQIDGIGREAMRVLDPHSGEHILDIGCGCGQTTIQLAECVGPDGAVTGVDISRPMLEVARRRPVPADGQVRFRQADAQTADLGVAAFDAAFSRFGVMFFADPTAAFGNIARALKPGGRLTFACWSAPAENPWMTMPLMAAAHLLPPLPPPDPTAPGPFAFAEPERVMAVLDESFATVSIQRFESLIGGFDLDGAVNLALNVGPLGGALRENPAATDKVTGAVREALAPYATPDGVRMPSAVWIVSAWVA